MIPREPNPPPPRFTPALVVLVLLVFAIVGSMDYHAAEREHAHYCAMVEAGHWPDFKNLQGECDDE